MENSMDSMSKAASYNEATTECSREESGWTMYLEDFFVNNNNHIEEDDQNSSLSSAFGGPAASLISDAASSKGKKCADNELIGGSSLEKRCRRLSFKKRKNSQRVFFDDDLEDTASSPVASPKVCNMMKNPKRKDDMMGISQEKGNTSEKGASRRSDELGFIGRDRDCTELKKKGLCLVPLSLMANYFG